MKNSLFFVYLPLVVFVHLPAAASDPLDPPVGYYDNASGTGSILKAQLNDIIDQHTQISYSNRETGIEFLDQDPGNPQNVLQVYSGFSVAKSQFPGGSANTEHLWPNSYGIDDAAPAYGDLFNLRPCNASVNSSRGNKYYDNVGGSSPAHAQAPECRADSTRWEPRPVEKGDLARIMFYMDVRYEGDATDGLSRNLQLTDDVLLITSTNNNMGKLSTLVQWHFEDPVAPEERLRNHQIYSGCGYSSPANCQGNRNPFVDRPEFVWALWGGFPNDSTLYFGESQPPDGATPLALELPAMILGWTAANHALLLNKSGLAPTTYEVILDGDAVCDDAGPRRAFVSGSLSKNISAGLSPAIAAGVQQGSVTFRNTDLTSQGPGRGAADGDDVVSISRTVLDHAVPSFSAAQPEHTLVIDFGEISQGTGIHSVPFEIRNLEQTIGFTAALDVNQIQTQGDLTALGTTATSFTALPAGSSIAFWARLDTARQGMFSASWVFKTFDQNLPGAAAGPDLTLTLIGTVSAAVPCDPADANCDQVLDEADISTFVDILLGQQSPCAPCSADMNQDSAADGADISYFITSML